MKPLMGLALAAFAVPQQMPGPAPRLERIEMETSSWGRTISSWSIDARGNGRLTRAEAGPAGAARMVTRSFAAGTAGFRRVRVLIGIAEQHAGTRLICTQEVTDAIYGSVRWVQAGGRAVSLSFYTECREYAARSVVAQLQKANTLAAQWADKGPVVATRPVERR